MINIYVFCTLIVDELQLQQKLPGIPFGFFFYKQNKWNLDQACWFIISSFFTSNFRRFGRLMWLCNFNQRLAIRYICIYQFCNFGWCQCFSKNYNHFNEHILKILLVRVRKLGTFRVRILGASPVHILGTFGPVRKTGGPHISDSLNSELWMLTYTVYPCVSLNEKKTHNFEYLTIGKNTKFRVFTGWVNKRQKKSKFSKFLSFYLAYEP